MQLIDGRALAQKIYEEMASEIARLGFTPGLGVILVGNHPASEHYVELKKRKAEEIGFNVDVRALPAATAQKQLESEITNFNTRADIHGFIVQLPLPPRISTHAALSSIDPKKDADGLHPLNLGNLARGTPTVIPATPRGILALIESTGARVEGVNAVVVGRSAIVGMPVALLLLQRNATVTVCHSRTKNLAKHTKEADILVVAAGKPGLVKGEMIKNGACVIDVGSTKVAEKWKGDVDFEDVQGLALSSTGLSPKAKVGFITPVPGGVGPMTVAMLLRNTLELAKSNLRP